MTERDKIINIVEQNKYCDVNAAANCRECKYSKELENYKDMGCSSLKTADALIAAGIGDVTEYKRRADVAERALLRLCEEIMRDKLIIMYPVARRQVRDKQELYDYCIEKAERELAEEKNEQV